MEIKVTPTKSFEVKIDGLAIGEFKKVSSWESFVKLKGSAGEIIVVDETDGFTRMLNSIGFLSDEMPEKYKIVKLSQSIRIFIDDNTVMDEAVEGFSNGLSN